MKQVVLLFVALSSLISGCGGTDSSDGSLVNPLIPGTGPGNWNNCSGPNSWLCQNMGPSVIFGTGDGYYVGPVPELSKGSIPNSFTYVATNANAFVSPGNFLKVTGHAYWGDIDFWDATFGWFTNDDACDKHTDKPANIVVFYEGLVYAGGAKMVKPGFDHQVVPTSPGSKLYFGFDPSQKSDNDECLEVENITLTKY